MVTIITYLLVASIILFFEVIFPLGLWALFSIGFYGMAVFMAWGSYGYIGGLTALAAAVSLAGITLYLELRLLPNTALGRKFMLKDKIAAHSAPTADLSGLIGLSGTALTSLTPSGRVSVGGQTHEAQSIEGQIIEGGAVIVTEVTPYGLKVKKA